MSAKKPGQVVIISSPSGGGKTSICRRLLSPARKKAGWKFSVSYTTRKPRAGERDGREYFFASDKKFDDLQRRGFFAESFKVHLYKYGTPRAPIDRIRKQGGVMVFDLDVKGARRLHQVYPDAIAIFVLPPSIAALRRRLKKRGTETARQLAIRFENAKTEMRSFQKYNFDYVVVNQDLNKAVRQVLAVVEAHACRIENIDREQLSEIVG